ncbi:hypothetical protein K9L67_01920 [Candidatus Woesearchaeota archaeon]|nr:hypothetical protein [Candidatus Woesearchaeota archaeon]MCF7900961.1 hypothetical protein [Candidatus Woesearchaeota archaeon]MCF8013593.1 hypothetical protein [Candidatus Woesearchaeota archaeon]
MFKLDLNQFNNASHPTTAYILKIIFYILEYIIVFPIIILIWTIALTVLAVLMSSQTSQDIILLTFAVVATIRATAYYNEDLSRDISKLLPFALLGVFIVNSSSFNIQSLNDMARIASINLPTLVHYFLFIVVLEFVLRIWHLISYLSPIEKAEDKYKLERKDKLLHKKRIMERKILESKFKKFKRKIKK